MTACEEVRAQLGAYLDGELDDAARAETALHVEACIDCRNELRALEATRGALRGRFEAWIEEAPPPPDAVLDRSERWPPLESKKRSIMMKSLTGIAALIVLTASIYFLIPGEPVDASPSALIKRASANYLAWDDVELRVGLHFKAFDFLARLSDDAEPDATAALLLKLVLQAPNRFLFHPEGDAKGFPLVDGFSGFDGEYFWSYDEEKKAVRKSLTEMEGEMITVTYKSENFGGTNTFPKDVNLMNLLSWDYMKELNRGGPDLGIVEITKPYDERTGRRVFKLTARKKEKDEEEDSFFEKMWWTSSRITINAAEDMVERYELDVRFALFTLVTLDVEVVKVNQGLPRDFFNFSSHVPAGTPVIETAPPEESAESE
jgi:outer membrane lipoprotein-sorting protein